MVSWQYFVTASLVSSGKTQNTAFRIVQNPTNKLTPVKSENISASSKALLAVLPSLVIPNPCSGKSTMTLYFLHLVWLSFYLCYSKKLDVFCCPVLFFVSVLLSRCKIYSFIRLNPHVEGGQAQLQGLRIRGLARIASTSLSI